MEFKRIDIATTRKLLEEAAENGMQLVDIRDERSFAQGHISTAVHLDNSAVQTFIENADLDKPLVIYCYHGNMSQSAAAYFSEQGFEDTYSVDGGFADWEIAYSDKVETASEV